MLCLLIQLQINLQLDLKTNITHNHQKIKPYGSLTTKDLKKPHSSRWVRGVEMQIRSGEAGGTVWHWVAAEWVGPHSQVVDKNSEGDLRSKGSQGQARPVG